jgi:aminoglycoside 6'-N-acetyltransferase
VSRRYGPLAEGIDPTEAFIVHLVDRKVDRKVGYVQSYRIDDDPEWRAVLQQEVHDVGDLGIDYFIGEPDLVGIGVGRRMIAQFVAACWVRYPSADQITVLLQQGNVASWKALEASGFRRLWSGDIESSDPSDRGPSFIYIANRAPSRASTAAQEPL